MEYRHTQNSYTGILVGVGSLVLFVVILAAGDESVWTNVFAGAAIVLVVGVVLVFNRLTVVVDAGTMRVGFGFGWPRKVIAVSDIVTAHKVRNKWYYGWGMRRVPGGWMYNVWGLDAVELDLSSGAKFRVGTNDASDLLAALSLHTSLRTDEG